MLHSGCEYFGLQSSCYDVPWYDEFFQPKTFRNWTVGRFELVVLKLPADRGGLSQQDEHPLIDGAHDVVSARVHLIYMLYWTMCKCMVQETFSIEIPFYHDSEFKARRLRPNAVCWIGIPCSTWVFLCLVHCPLQGTADFTMAFVFPPFQYIHGLPFGGLPSWYACVSTNLVKFEMIWLECCSWCLVKKTKEPGLNTPQLVQVFRSGANQLWDSSVSTDLFAHS